MSNKESTEDVPAEAAHGAHTRREINWFKTLWHIHMHVFALYGLYLIFTQAKTATIIFAFVVGWFSLIGVSAGAHRLWAHRSFSASLPLRLFLLLCQTASCTGSVYDWVLEHRVHHRHHGTDDDPSNHRRGFLFSHLLSRVVARPARWTQLARDVDMADLEADALVMLQKRFYWVLMPVAGILVPMNWPIEYWGEDILTSFVVAFAMRYVIVMHFVWLISSGILVWGLRPENNYSFNTNLVFIVDLSMWPHYHYLLPWDYQTCEWGGYGKGATTALVRAWAALGWARDLRTVDTAGVRRAVERFVRAHDEAAQGAKGEGEAAAAPFTLVQAVEEEGRLYSERIAQEHLQQRPETLF